MVERRVVESSWRRWTRYDIGNRRRCTVEVTWGSGVYLHLGLDPHSLVRA